VIRIADALAEPVPSPAARFGGARSLIQVPMLKDNTLIGAITIYRQEVHPFTEKQIDLVKNFAAQAVIAIENTRLLNELRQSLEQQTATSEVLSIISRSPGELEPVFQTILENATRICGANFGALSLREGDAFRSVAMHDVSAALAERRQRDPLIPLTPGHNLERLVRTKDVVHVPDLSADMVAAPIPYELAGARALLNVPLLKDNEVIGSILIYRHEAGPFADKQIEPAKNFAAQAVIAMENARLLNELHQRTDDLTESLEQQTATSEVLKVISSSPGELEPVFQAMLESAVRICEAKFGVMLRFDGDESYAVATLNLPPAVEEFFRQRGRAKPTPGSHLDRLMNLKRVIHTEDMQASSTPSRIARLAFVRTEIAVPMVNDAALIGAIMVYRQEVRPFTNKQIELVQNFAAQAVIAIENTRLLNELRESLEQQTATADVLRVISSSPGELQPVFQTMLENSLRICEAKFGTLLLRDGDAYRGAAEVGTPAELAEYNRRGPFQAVPGSPLDRVTRTKQVSHVADAAAEAVLTPPARLAGARSLLAVPMLKDNVLIGAITIYRQEVRPFSDKQIALVQNFAAQAVIAIENTRLLSELRQSLEQQTATSQVLQVISSSPGELQPVFEAMLVNATRICGARVGVLFRYHDGAFTAIAKIGVSADFAAYLAEGPIRPGPNTGLRRLIETKQTVHIVDSRDGQAYADGDPWRVATADLLRARSLLNVRC
jgi:GAF domain-containing protein